jgi:hypothetical protein
MEPLVEEMIRTLADLSGTEWGLVTGAIAMIAMFLLT